MNWLKRRYCRLIYCCKSTEEITENVVNSTAVRTCINVLGKTVYKSLSRLDLISESGKP